MRCESSKESCYPGRFFFDCVSILVGVIFLISATLKTFSFSTINLSLEWMVVFCEITIGLSLVFLQVSRKFFSIVAILLLAVFALYTWTIYQNGIETCECFGPILLSPKITVWLDLGLLSLLLFASIFKSPSAKDRLTCSISTCILVVATCFLFFAFSTRSDGILFLDIPGKSEKYAIIDLAKYQNRKADFLTLFDGSEKLFRGKWEILVIDSTCQKCKLKMEQFSEMQYGNKAILVLDGNTVGVTSRLVTQVLAKPRYKVVAKVPTFLRLEDGIVFSKGEKL